MHCLFVGRGVCLVDELLDPVMILTNSVLYSPFISFRSVPFQRHSTDLLYFKNKSNKTACTIIWSNGVPTAVSVPFGPRHSKSTRLRAWYVLGFPLKHGSSVPFVSSIWFALHALPWSDLFCIFYFSIIHSWHDSFLYSLIPSIFPHLSPGKLRRSVHQNDATGGTSIRGTPGYATETGRRWSRRRWQIDNDRYTTDKQ